MNFADLHSKILWTTGTRWACDEQQQARLLVASPRQKGRHLVHKVWTGRPLYLVLTSLEAQLPVCLVHFGPYKMRTSCKRVFPHCYLKTRSTKVSFAIFGLNYRTQGHLITYSYWITIAPIVLCSFFKKFLTHHVKRVIQSGPAFCGCLGLIHWQFYIHEPGPVVKNRHQKSHDSAL